MVGRLSAAIAKQDDVSVQLEALDILGDLLGRYVFGVPMYIQEFKSVT